MTVTVTGQATDESPSRRSVADILGFSTVGESADVPPTRRAVAEALGLSVSGESITTPPSRRAVAHGINLALGFHGPLSLAFAPATGTLTWALPFWEVPTTFKVEVQRGTAAYATLAATQDATSYVDGDYDSTEETTYRVTALTSAGDAQSATVVVETGETDGTVVVEPSGTVEMDDPITATLTDADNPTAITYLWENYDADTDTWSASVSSGASTHTVQTSNAAVGALYRCVVSYTDDYGSQTATSASVEVVERVRVADSDWVVRNLMQESDSPGSDSAGIDWDAPSDGTPDGGYEWELLEGGTTVDSGQGFASRAVVRSLSPGTEYVFRVRPVDDDTYGGWTTNTFTTLIVAPPLAPINIDDFGRRTNEVRIYWQAGVGGTTPTGFEIRWLRLGQYDAYTGLLSVPAIAAWTSWFTDTGGGSTNPNWGPGLWYVYRMTGLTRQNLYDVQIRARAGSVIGAVADFDTWTQE